MLTLLTRTANDHARVLATGALRRAFGGGRTRPSPSVDASTSADPGLFGPGSVTWRVHSDLAMFVGGVRALLVQTTHPLAMAGIAQHSAYRDDPLGRLDRTAQFVAATTYGTTAEAESAITHVRAVHTRVRGRASDGRPYAANDPHLLSWVHHTEVHSFLVAAQRYGSAIDAHDADAYVGEMSELGHRLGVVDAATSVRELRDVLDAFRPELAITKEARDAVRFLLVPPLPVATRPAHAVITAAAVGLLPLSTRLALRLPPAVVVDPLVVQPAARALLATLRWALGASPVRRSAEERCAAASQDAGACSSATTARHRSGSLR